MPTQEVRDEIEGPPEVRVLEVSVSAIENTQMSNEVQTTTVRVSDFRNIVNDDMNIEIADSLNVENVHGLHAVPSTSGIQSRICSAECVVEKQQRMELTCNKECKEGGMDETMSDETVSMHDFDLCSQGDSLCSGEVNLQEFSQDDSSLYTLEEINAFLDDTFGKQVNVIDYFSDIEKFEKSISIHQKNVGFEILSEKKRFR